jgi:phosphinothricin acetyltransferase
VILVRPASIADLARITEIHNYYVLNTHIIFDVRPFSTEQRVPWFKEHTDNSRHRILVAENHDGKIVGYTATGSFRSKEAYETTVEVSIACSPESVNQGIGKQLYQALFSVLENEDIHRVVAGIAQPNAASNALHESFGFQKVGTFTQVGRKFGQFWDVLWMEKSMPR